VQCFVVGSMCARARIRRLLGPRPTPGDVRPSLRASSRRSSAFYGARVSLERARALSCSAGFCAKPSPRPPAPTPVARFGCGAAPADARAHCWPSARRAHTPRAACALAPPRDALSRVRALLGSPVPGAGPACLAIGRVQSVRRRSPKPLVRIERPLGAGPGRPSSVRRARETLVSTVCFRASQGGPVGPCIRTHPCIISCGPGQHATRKATNGRGQGGSRLVRG
jgi:hypothetical protein